MPFSLENPEEIQAEKNEMRLNLKEQFSREINPKKIDTFILSMQIFKQLYTLPQFHSAQNILAYGGVDLCEVPTQPLLTSIITSKSLYLPKVQHLMKNMIFYEVFDFSHMTQTNSNTLEPIQLETPFNQKTDTGIILVPGIGFDKDGNRLGKGGGYYDKYLENNNLYKIGLAFDFQIQPYIPTDKHDVPVDMIITPSDIIKINH
jgi:5-formyltetrahydrofolate cyclo-ligase